MIKNIIIPASSNNSLSNNLNGSQEIDNYTTIWNDKSNK